MRAHVGACVYYPISIRIRTHLYRMTTVVNYNNLYTRSQCVYCVGNLSFMIPYGPVTNQFTRPISRETIFIVIRVYTRTYVV